MTSSRPPREGKLRSFLQDLLQALSQRYCSFCCCCCCCCCSCESDFTSLCSMLASNLKTSFHRLFFFLLRKTYSFYNFVFYLLVRIDIRSPIILSFFFLPLVYTRPVVSTLVFPLVRLDLYQKSRKKKRLFSIFTFNSTI